jgi:hypothetical protein
VSFEDAVAVSTRLQNLHLRIDSSSAGGYRSRMIKALTAAAQYYGPLS